jgi:serpin B
MKRTITLVLALSLLAAACGADDEGATTTTATTSTSTSTTSPSGIEFVSADLPRATASTGQGALAAVVAADTELAFDLLRYYSPDGENLFLSPYSIATALGMTYAGARGATENEMANVLHVVDIESVHAGRNAIELGIEAAGSVEPLEGEPPPLVLKTANQLWGQGGFPFTDDFLATLAENYGAGMRLVDYIGDPDGSRVLINDWVEEQTEDRIQDLIPEGVITQDTRLTLVNAVYLLANWLHEFDPDRTAPGPFFTLTGTKVAVPMMQNSIRTNYADGDGYQAVVLPYVGDASMLVVLPDEGEFSEYVAALDPDRLQQVRDLVSDHQVELTLPKFEFKSSLGLKEALIALGMPTAFEPPVGDSGADFTGMTEDRILYIQDALHQAFVSVDEKGTEAAAATAVIAGVTSAPPPAEMIVDRPFLFFILQNSTGEMLFAGQVVDPASS